MPPTPPKGGSTCPKSDLTYFLAISDFFWNKNLLAKNFFDPPTNKRGGGHGAKKSDLTNFLGVSDHFQQFSKKFHFFLLHLLTVAIATQNFYKCQKFSGGAKISNFKFSIFSAFHIISSNF